CLAETGSAAVVPAGLGGAAAGEVFEVGAGHPHGLQVDTAVRPQLGTDGVSQVTDSQRTGAPEQPGGEFVDAGDPLEALLDELPAGGRVHRVAVRRYERVEVELQEPGEPARVPRDVGVER